MKNPRQVEVIKEGASYLLPTYEVTNNSIVDGLGSMIHFCKGSTNDENIFKQEGMFTESLLTVVKLYLESVNVGEMKTEYTTEAIKNIQLALMWIDQRRIDRENRKILGTYQK